jgi:hypothetical protein
MAHLTRCKNILSVQLEKLNQQKLSSTDEASIIEILGDDSLHWIIAVANSNAYDDIEHAVNINGKSFIYIGNYKLWIN